MSDLLKQYSTGQGPLNASLVIPEGKTYQLMSVSLKIDVAPTTSESITVTRNSAGGDVYDVALYIIDPSILVVTDIFWQPDQPVYLAAGDGLTVAWSNTDVRLWGLEFTVLRVHP